MSASQKIVRILIVDDHEIVRSGIRFSLSTFEDLEVVGEARDGEDALHLCRELEPDVVLMDIRMPNVDGICATRVIRRVLPQVQVLVLSSFDDAELVRRAMDAGAISYLIKGVSAHELAEAIRAAHAGQSRLSPEAVQALVRRPDTKPQLGEDLTAREREVLPLLAQGYANAQIAQHLTVSLSTVKYHVHGIFSKLGAANRAEAVALALQHDLIARTEPVQL